MIDSWFRPYPPTLNFTYVEPGKIEDYLSVPPDAMPLAEQILEDISIFPIEGSSLRRLGVDRIAPADKSLYLVRALYMKRDVKYRTTSRTTSCWSITARSGRGPNLCGETHW